MSTVFVLVDERSLDGLLDMLSAACDSPIKKCLAIADKIEELSRLDILFTVKFGEPGAEVKIDGV